MNRSSGPAECSADAKLRRSAAFISTRNDRVSLARCPQSRLEREGGRVRYDKVEPLILMPTYRLDQISKVA